MIQVTHKMLVIVVLALSLAVVCGLVIAIARSDYPHLVKASYPDRIELLGRPDSKGARFFSIRVVETSTKEPVPSKCPLLFHWRGQVYRVAQITPDLARRMGAEVHPRDYGPPNGESGFIGGYDAQNRDFGVEFSFKDSRLIGFYARFHRDADCPFGISFEGRPIARFHFDTNQLESSFGKPARVEEFPYK